MTSNINNQSATALATGETIVLTVGDATIELNVKQVTPVLTVLLAARKDSYEQTRQGKAEATKAAKAEREAKEAERTAAKTKKLADRKAKLEAELAKLTAATAAPAAAKGKGKGKKAA